MPLARNNFSHVCQTWRQKDSISRDVFFFRILSHAHIFIPARSRRSHQETNQPTNQTVTILDIPGGRPHAFPSELAHRLGRARGMDGGPSWIYYTRTRTRIHILISITPYPLLSPDMPFFIVFILGARIRGSAGESGQGRDIGITQHCIAFPLLFSGRGTGTMDQISQPGREYLTVGLRGWWFICLYMPGPR